MKYSQETYEKALESLAELRNSQRTKVSAIPLILSLKRLRKRRIVMFQTRYR